MGRRGERGAQPRGALSIEACPGKRPLDSGSRRRVRRPFRRCPACPLTRPDEVWQSAGRTVTGQAVGKGQGLGSQAACPGLQGVCCEGTGCRRSPGPLTCAPTLRAGLVCQGTAQPADQSPRPELSQKPLSACSSVPSLPWLISPHMAEDSPAVTGSSGPPARSCPFRVKGSLSPGRQWAGRLSPSSGKPADRTLEFTLQ